ncbi:DUF5694 domain-containing protein [Sandaracinobacteroides saxicola]|uniref:TraB/GumN family protein n=1 Tax=Sandaracinobacteroides saxicola TaxID=2759707 RepID=A0A7G5IH12_9SPHN|nr:DUF5694 domain-containing protein [Sandaracinobacteroides saxicola]QMW22654.1 hypothetical protein H3309_15305 [Sandaracinobacteroides saxicola]
MKTPFLLAALLLATPTLATPPAFGGPPTTIFVLGSTHLSQTPGIKREYLPPLLDRLAGTRADIIVLEGLSGIQCDTLRRFEPRYPGMYRDYCRAPDIAAKSTGLDVPAATAAWAATLKNWPAAPTPAQRRTLASQFAAGGELESALVQWLRLPPAERTEGDGIDTALKDLLNKRELVMNENTQIGVPLAVRLRHERVFMVDDHTADSIQAESGPALDPWLTALWKSPAAAAFGKVYNARQNRVTDGPSLIAFYRWINTPAAQQAANRVDQGAAALDAKPPHLGRHYLAWWETRNLRMVANIREAAGARPGARILAIVGSSHKLPYERYLATQTDMRVADIDPLLR